MTPFAGGAAPLQYAYTVYDDEDALITEWQNVNITDLLHGAADALVTTTTFATASKAFRVEVSASNGATSFAAVEATKASAVWPLLKCAAPAAVMTSVSTTDSNPATITADFTLNRVFVGSAARPLAETDFAITVTDKRGVKVDGITPTPDSDGKFLVSGVPTDDKYYLKIEVAANEEWQHTACAPIEIRNDVVSDCFLLNVLLLLPCFSFACS